MSEKPWPGLAWSAVLLLAALAAQAGSAWLWLALWPGVDLTLMAGLANLTALLPVAAVGYLVSGQAPAAKLPATQPWLVTALVLSAAGGTVVLGELSNLIAWLLPLPSGLAHLFNELTEGSPVVALFTLAFVAPLTEEALFRGLLLRAYARRWGPWPALLLSSALFALFHLNPWQAVPAFLAGLFLGWLYLTTGSLWPSIAAHAVFNGLPVSLAAAGWHIAGYNTPTVPGTPDFQPWPWLLLGAAVLAAGLGLAARWAPLPPPPDSDTVAG